MAHPAFDTLKFVETLTESGIDEQHARGLLKAVGRSMLEMTDELVVKADLQAAENRLEQKILAVKSDLQQTESRLEQKIQLSEHNLRQAISKVENDINLLKWSMSVVITGIVALVLKAFF